MNKLPVSYKKYFWDCDFDRLDLDVHKEYILKRLLDFGDITAIKFILSEISLQDVKNLLEKNGQYALSRRSYLFWQKLVKYDELWNSNNAS